MYKKFYFVFKFHKKMFLKLNKQNIYEQKLSASYTFVLLLDI